MRRDRKKPALLASGEHLWIYDGMEIQHALRLQQSAPAPYMPSNIDAKDVPF